MPNVPGYSKEEATLAIGRSSSWADALRFLGLSPRGKNLGTIRKWAARWELDVSHLPAYAPGKNAPSFSESQLREAIARSRSWAETLRNLDACPTGGNPRTAKKWAATWGIDSSHFDPDASRRAALSSNWRDRKPLDEILIEESTYSRSALKMRLYEEGLKEPRCEMCGQGEAWNGMEISMILDHINGIRNDNRLENLQIVCPNCAAGLDTHCGKGKKKLAKSRDCKRCGEQFRPKYRDHVYCSRDCGQRSPRSRQPRPDSRKAERPPLDQLLAEIKRLGFCGVGRKYGVSDNAIRKWVRSYEEERAIADGRDPTDVEIPTRTWPNQRGLIDD